MALSVLLVTFNGLRPVSGATLADLVFVVGAGLLALHYLSPSTHLPRLPLWLVGSAYAVFAIGLLSAIMAPPVVERGLPDRFGGAVYLPFATDFAENVGAAVRFSGTLVLAPLLIGLVSDSRARLERIIDFWMVSVVINGIVALGDAFHLTSIGQQVAGVSFGVLGRENGLTLHPNHLAMAAAMALPVAFARATTARSALRRWLTWGATGVIAAAIGVSGARSGLVAGGIGVLLVLLVQRHERGRLVAGVAIGGVVAVLLMSIGGTGALGKLNIGFERLLGTGATSTARVDVSDAARRTSFQSAINSIPHHPVAGTGFAGVRDAHDLYLQLLQSGGVLLLCAFGVFAGGALRLGHRLLGDSRLAPDLQSLSGALMVSAGVWLIAGLAQNPIYDRYLYVPVGFLLGLHFQVSREAAHAR